MVYRFFSVIALTWEQPTRWNFLDSALSTTLGTGRGVVADFFTGEGAMLSFLGRASGGLLPGSTARPDGIGVATLREATCRLIPRTRQTTEARTIAPMASPPFWFDFRAR